MYIEFVEVSYFLFLCSSVEDIQIFEPLIPLVTTFLSILQARPTKHPFNLYEGCNGVLEQRVDKGIMRSCIPKFLQNILQCFFKRPISFLGYTPITQDCPLRQFRNNSVLSFPQMSKTHRGWNCPVSMPAVLP